MKVPYFCFLLRVVWYFSKKLKHGQHTKYSFIVIETTEGLFDNYEKYKVETILVEFRGYLKIFPKKRKRLHII